MTFKQLCYYCMYPIRNDFWKEFKDKAGKMLHASNTECTSVRIYYNKLVPSLQEIYSEYQENIVFLSFSN